MLFLVLREAVVSVRMAVVRVCRWRLLVCVPMAVVSVCGWWLCVCVRVGYLSSERASERAVLAPVPGPALGSLWIRASEKLFCTASTHTHTPLLLLNTHTHV